MHDLLPAAALAHFVMKVENVETSYQFYSGLGLRPVDRFPGMAIVELRGGTHLLPVQKGNEQTDDLLNSHSGQRAEYHRETLDLMIAGHAKQDLETYREALVGKGYVPSEIADTSLYGHAYFSLPDPDGNGITFYTSHCSDKPV